MLRLVLISFLLLLASASSGFAESPSVTVQDAASKPWAKYCHLRGIKFTDLDERMYLARFAERCEGVDACLLSCIRSGCAKRVGGGCFHMCSASVGADLTGMDQARQYEDRTAYLCRRPPVRSEK